MNPPLKAVLFDLDGVLVHSPLDLAAIKNELFGDTSVFIIEGIENLPENERVEKCKILEQREMEAARNAWIDPFVPELFNWLENHDLLRGVITRNCRSVVNIHLERFSLDLGVVIAREDAPPKPDPASIYAACDQLGVTPDQCIMVGDFHFDILAGNSAGCRTVFLETEEFKHLDPGATVRIKNLSELVGILESWLNAPAKS